MLPGKNSTPWTTETSLYRCRGVLTPRGDVGRSPCSWWPDTVILSVVSRSLTVRRLHRCKFHASSLQASCRRACTDGSQEFQSGGFRYTDFSELPYCVFHESDEESFCPVQVFQAIRAGYLVDFACSLYIGGVRGSEAGQSAQCRSAFIGVHATERYCLWRR